MIPMSTDQNKPSDSRNDTTAMTEQKEPKSERKEKRKKTKRKKRKKSSRRHSTGEKSDVSALTHDSTASRTSAMSTSASTFVTSPVTSMSRRASSLPTLPVFESSAVLIHSPGAPASPLRKDSTGCDGELPQGTPPTTTGGEGPRQLPEAPSRTTLGERRPSDGSGVPTSSSAILPGKQSSSRRWGGSLFDLTPSTRIDDTTTTAVAGSRPRSMFQLFGQWAHPVLPQPAGVASNATVPQNQSDHGLASSNAGASVAPPLPVAGQGKSETSGSFLPSMPAVQGYSAPALQPDGRGLIDQLRAAQQGQPETGSGGARRCRSCKSREMGYSYFTSETERNREAKKAGTAFNSSGLESMQNFCRFPDSTTTSPRSRAAFCETTLIAAGFCLFWAAFAIIVMLMRERRGASDDHGDPLCQTDDCIRHAKLLANITAASTVDPCDDFSAYVCSVWFPLDRLQKGGGHYASSSAVDATINTWYEGLGETLNAGVSHLPIGIKALEMYAACVAGSSKYGTNPAEFLRFMKEIGLSWPEPPPEDVDALSVFVSLTFDFEAPAWFSVDVSESRDRKRWRLVISPDGYLPILLVQQRGILKSGGFASHWRRIWNALVPDVTPPGDHELEADLRTMEDILGKLRGAASSPRKESTPLSLGDMGGYTEPVSSSSWLDALNKTLPLSVTTATEVYITDVGYVRTVGSLFAKYNDRQLVRHLSWLFVQLYGPVADPSLLVDRHGSDEVANASRALFCGSNVEVSYKLLVSMLYFVSSISVHDRTLVNACFESLIVTGVEKVANTSWLDVDSKLLAGDKIKAVEARVWPDEVLVKTNFLEQIYEEFPEGRTSFAAYWVESRRKIRHLKRRKLYRRLSTQPPCFREPYLSYDATLNRVLFAISALVRPLFYSNGTKGMLYGGIGFLMALEIVKSLDVAGLRWGPNGNLVADSILSKSSMEEYAERATCYGVERNVSAFPEVPALEVAYAAFQQALKTDGRRYRIGYNFTEERVFFLTLCLTTCLRRYTVMSPVGTDCNKAVKNFPPFAKTFSCPDGSNMNPNDRCRFFD